MQKHTSMSLNYVKLVAGSMVFEVTNTNYMTQQTPALQLESIPLASTAVDDAEQLAETAGITVGRPYAGMEYGFLVNGTLNGHTWNDFFADPFDSGNDFTLLVVYYNPDTVGFASQYVFVLTVKEKT